MVSDEKRSLRNNIEELTCTGTPFEEAGKQKLEAFLGDGLYVPAELSISEYFLKEGVISAFHSLINPSVNILGLHYNALQYSETTHGLPLPPNALSEKNFADIYNKVLNFMGTIADDYLPLF
uniref:Maelstrom domain-containing protein n=1 Tax=Glossina brevipalpis TaxID=37001 RepID=A0A1A9WEU8_9MUSC